MTLARVMSRVRQRLLSEDIHMFDAWYLDDGQIVCHPDHIETVLKIIDIEAAKDGASRAIGKDAKTVVRILGSAVAETA